MLTHILCLTILQYNLFIAWSVYNIGYFISRPISSIWTTKISEFSARSFDQLESFSKLYTRGLSSHESKKYLYMRIKVDIYLLNTVLTCLVTSHRYITIVLIKQNFTKYKIHFPIPILVCICRFYLVLELPEGWL